MVWPSRSPNNPSRNTFECTSRRWGYEERVVVNVATEDILGNRFALVTCHRNNL